MNKRQVIEQIQAYLVEELRPLAEATDNEKLTRAGEIQRQLTMYRFLPVREYGKDDVICPGALIELDLNGTRAFYFLVPQGGGLVMKIEGRPVQVITPQSPLGEALLGKKVGEKVLVEVAGKNREYRIIALS